MRPAMLVLGITFGTAVSAQAQAISWLVPQAAAACDEAVKLPKIVNREKDLKGPVLILWRDSAQTPWTLGKVSADYIRRLAYEKKDPKTFNPVSAGEVRMVACGTRGASVKVGEYMIAGKTEKQAAVGYDYEIRVIEWPSKTPVARWSDRTEPLQVKKENDSNIATPDATNVAIVISTRMP